MTNEANATASESRDRIAAGYGRGRVEYTGTALERHLLRDRAQDTQADMREIQQKRLRRRADAAPTDEQYASLQRGLAEREKHDERLGLYNGTPATSLARLAKGYGDSARDAAKKIAEQ